MFIITHLSALNFICQVLVQSNRLFRSDKIEDSSPTLLKTVHRHICSKLNWHMVKNITVNYEKSWTNYDLKVKVYIIGSE